MLSDAMHSSSNFPYHHKSCFVIKRHSAFRKEKEEEKAPTTANLKYCNTPMANLPQTYV